MDSDRRRLGIARRQPCYLGLGLGHGTALRRAGFVPGAAGIRAGGAFQLSRNERDGYLEAAAEEEEMAGELAPAGTRIEVWDTPIWKPR